MNTTSALSTQPSAKSLLACIIKLRYPGFSSLKAQMNFLKCLYHQMAVYLGLSYLSIVYRAIGRTASVERQ